METRKQVIKCRLGLRKTMKEKKAKKIFSNKKKDEDATSSDSDGKYKKQGFEGDNRRLDKVGARPNFM